MDRGSETQFQVAENLNLLAQCSKVRGTSILHIQHFNPHGTNLFSQLSLQAMPPVLQERKSLNTSKAITPVIVMSIYLLFTRFPQ